MTAEVGVIWDQILVPILAAAFGMVVIVRALQVTWRIANRCAFYLVRVPLEWLDRKLFRTLSRAQTDELRAWLDSQR